MDLGTFGAVVKFALDLEATAAAFYETATTITSNQNLKGFFEKMIIQRQGRIALLMRVRREHTTEMILEPIMGLESEKYRPKTECPEGCDDKTLGDLATLLEEKIQAFYIDASEKVSFLSEAVGFFEKLADENIENKEAIEMAI